MNDGELTLYHHPFAAFCQKALIALHERDVPFTRKMIDLGDPGQRAELEAVWPFARFPVLIDAANGRRVAEASIIIEYLDRRSPGLPMIPVDPDDALDARFWDRIFDLNIASSVTKLVVDTFRPDGQSDAMTVDVARRDMEIALQLVDEHMVGREWVAGERFSLADCAAAPALFYAQWAAPYDAHRPHAYAYLQRLMARPSFAAVLEDARPHRHLFPLKGHPAPEAA